ncbi:hypothetical protein WR25_09777 [Diploscapter pachys]|uniref:CAP-Gly domain-containing protein n=1 Tax=Diploscapter pachys TaxID=2018661 RepID=A0A2A2K3J4_9BILA|nr:hypothetical protein WR25_09777 [Diploscapter pachys]
MHKSHMQQTDNKQSVVTQHDVGKLVNVTGCGKGILRYVGVIHGKDGLFCGIELINSPGKHDGSYSGVSYFMCPQGRGIFAPLYKVTIDDAVPKPAQPSPSKITENRLSRSALPALPLRTIQQQLQNRDSSMESSTSGDDPMTSSFISDINMDGSTFSTGSWSDVDASMINSRYTYTVRKGFALLQDGEEDLMAVPALKSIVDVEQTSESGSSTSEQEDQPMGSSFVVDKSRIGKEKLPIVEDDDQKTPLVEVKPLPVNKSSQPAAQQPHSTTVADSNHNRVQNGAAVKNASGHVDGQKNANGNTSNGHLQTQAQTNAKAASSESKRMSMKPEKEKEQQKEEGKEETPRTKKASIEAEKNKPKKEVKSKVTTTIPVVATQEKKQNGGGQQQENQHDGQGMSEIKPQTKEEKKPKQPLKTVNEPAAAPVERPKKERKPLYEAPPAKERKEPPKSKLASSKASLASSKEENHNASDGAAINKGINDKKSVAAPKSAKPTSFPTSSFSGGKRVSAQSTPGSSSSAPVHPRAKSASHLPPD